MDIPPLGDVTYFYLLFALKYFRNILKPIQHPINLYIFFSNLVQHNIISTNHISIIRPKADPFRKVSSHIRKLLYIFKLGIYLLNGFHCHFLIIFCNMLFNVFLVFRHNGIKPQFHHRLYPNRMLKFIKIHPGTFFLNGFFCFL